ncbi:hypothetical protein PF005_g5187 [Phytophthora fragariae]|uniref:RxLR effector protein n=2 Tax=Phytophthora TaxID=4783 RepID=A0A6A4EGR3_9STRA|nr:hypothetical protein PF003_g36260 [Phytophthora fragariae]KAE9009407.1 hypothetical protein PR002_g15623 [Phytophthora rubi]KAE8944876.1 hypothetical protein PF009_g5455 [Phytophthora fragariae]KAE9013973.1 hypothetical protein PR001_g15255 [Phytophthora rubi]KAE9023124.1 hypothetical protein PF011_g4146 [Phytophthora fragariae]
MHLLTLVASAPCASTLPIPAPTSRKTSRSVNGPNSSIMTAIPDDNSPRVIAHSTSMLTHILGANIIEN